MCFSRKAFRGDSYVLNARHLPKKYSVMTSGHHSYRLLSFLLNRSHPTANASQESYVHNKFMRPIRVPFDRMFCVKNKMSETNV